MLSGSERFLLGCATALDSGLRHCATELDSDSAADSDCATAKAELDDPPPPDWRLS